MIKKVFLLSTIFISACYDNSQTELIFTCKTTHIERKIHHFDKNFNEIHIDIPEVYTRDMSFVINLKEKSISYDGLKQNNIKEMEISDDNIYIVWQRQKEQSIHPDDLYIDRTTGTGMYHISFKVYAQNEEQPMNLENQIQCKKQNNRAL